MNIILNDILGYIILFGIIASYIFQYVKIIRNKSSDGISELFIILGYIGSISSWNNAYIFYLPEYTDCSGYNQCSSEILGFLQLFSQWLCFLVLYIVFLFFYQNRKWKSWAFFVCCNLLLISVFVVTYIISKKIIDYVIIDTYADVLSTVTSTMVVIQYLPQIYVTFRDKDPGSLSLIMLLIQCPGSYIWTIFLALQDGSNYSTWIPFAITGTLQLILLGMGFYFSRVNKNSYLKLNARENLLAY